MHGHIKESGYVCQRINHTFCDSIDFCVPIFYNSVCGHIIGYQVGSMDAFGPFQHDCEYCPTSQLNTPQPFTIDDVYVEGLSLSHGHPGKHI